MYSYDTVTEAIEGLRKRGYNIDFNINFNQLVCSNNVHCLNPDDFEITEHYRFEGDSNPADEDVVYAVTSKDGKLRGILTAAYGTYADNISGEMIKKLSIHHQ
jgi:hypothetical protein